MKRIAFLASLLGFAKLAHGQNNRVSIERQVRGAPGTLISFDPSGNAVAIKPDASIMVDTAAGTIRAAGGTQRRQVVETQTITTAGQMLSPSAPLAPGTSLMIFYNQGLMLPGVNYTVATGNLISFTNPQVVPGDSVTLSFWT